MRLTDWPVCRTVSFVLDHGPVTLPAEPALPCAHTGPSDPAENRRLRRQVDQQRVALAHLSEALLGLRRGSEALRAENRDLRRELEAARHARNKPPVAAGSHADQIDAILRRTSP